MIVYFSSKTGNTRKFVQKLGSKDIIEISNGLVMNDPYVLIVPTYAKRDGTKSLHKNVVSFLNKNHTLIRGVVAGGNRNFGKFFGYAGDVVSHKCGIDILHKFELTGSDSDVYSTIKRIEETLNGTN